MNTKFSISALIPLTLLAASCESMDTTSSAAAPSRTASRPIPTWSIQYEGKIVPRGKNYHIVDLFDVSSSDLSALRAAGSKPIAYFSSQYEEWRADSAKFPKAAIGKKLGADRKQMIDDEVEAEIARAIELAESAPWPQPSELYTDVYKETI